MDQLTHQVEIYRLLSLLYHYHPEQPGHDP
jgi:hypothetical protein